MSTPPPPTDGGNKTTRVQLTLHANRLKNVAGTWKGISDPYCIVTLLASDSSTKPKVLGKTEVIKNTLNPQWTRAFVLDYELGKPEHINVGVYDEVRKSTDKPMGSATFEIGSILGAKGNIKAKKLRMGGALFARVLKAQKESAGHLTLGLRGFKLKNVEGFFGGKSDPFFELCRRIDGVTGTMWRPVYRSSHVENNLNPIWEPAEVSLDILCDGDLERPIHISVYDYERNGKHRPMGTIETTVNRFIASVTPQAEGEVRTLDKSRAFVLKWKGKNFGSILVTEAKVAGGTDRSDGPFLDSNIKVPPDVTTVMEASGVMSGPHSSFAAPKVATPTPPPADTNMRVSRDMEGLCVSTAPPEIVFPVESQNSSVPGSYVPAPFTIPTPNSGAPSNGRPPAFSPSSSLPATPNGPTFVDYISGGCELQMCVAIDFTGSNGDPRIPGTLHYVHKDGQLNDYEKAIKAVGSIVAKYDSDQKFPVWGFGAKYGGVVRHCFQCGPSAEVRGIDGVLEAYRAVFKTPLIMSSPTVFTEVINLAASQATRSQEVATKLGKQSYTILLILTDGAVRDVDATKKAILDASRAPLSIVIVGIGRADFGAMQFLDDLNVGRDIVQFVEFEAHKHSKTSLTRATLEEVPDQLVSYFQSRHIIPLPMPSQRLDVVEEEHDSISDFDLSVNIGPDGKVSLNQGGYLEDSWHGGISILPPPSIAGCNSGGSAYLSYDSAASQPAARTFKVQVPAGVTPGSQIQVRNPSTGQIFAVVVPQGVTPGGTFDVMY